MIVAFECSFYLSTTHEFDANRFVDVFGEIEDGFTFGFVIGSEGSSTTRWMIPALRKGKKKKRKNDEAKREGEGEKGKREGMSQG